MAMKRMETIEGWVVVVKTPKGKDIVAYANQAHYGRAVLFNQAFFSTRRDARSFVARCQVNRPTGRVVRGRVIVWSEQ